MPDYEGTGRPTTRVSARSRQSDLLMQQLGSSMPSTPAPTQRSAADDMGGLSMPAPMSAPNPMTGYDEFDDDDVFDDAQALRFDTSTDTRQGNPMRRRGSGRHLGDSVGSDSMPTRRPAAGMVTNGDELARRQQAFQGMASAPAPSRSPQQEGLTMPRRTPPGMGAQAPTGMDVPGDDDKPRMSLRGRLTQQLIPQQNFVNPITFIRENGGGLTTFGIWLHEYKQIFLILMLIFMVIGMLFTWNISLAAGLIMLLIGMWIENISEEHDATLILICGGLTALIPYILSAT